MGMMFFYKFLVDMPRIFGLFTIFALPIIYCYRGFDNGMNLQSIHTSYGKYSIANLGMDSIKENQFPIELEHFSIYCPYGHIQNASLSVHTVGTDSNDD